MSKWSDAWNELPYDIRHIGAMCEYELRIQHLQMEKNRLKKRYTQSLKEINEHIKNIQDWIKRENQG